MRPRSGSPSGGPPAQPRLRATCPADVISYVPHALGFMPAESLVFLTMAGTRLGATLRIDLPADESGDAGYARAVRSYLRSDEEADGVLMIMYTARRWTAPHRPPYRDLVDAIRAGLAGAGLELRDGWLVSESHWREYFCADAACCPWPGHALDAIADSTLSAELIYSGSSFAKSLDCAPELAPARYWDTLPQVSRELLDYRNALGERWEEPAQFTAVLRVWEGVFRRFGPAEEAGAPGAPGPLEQAGPSLAAFLLASLASRTVRDAVLVLAAHGFDAALAGARAHGLLRADRKGRRPAPAQAAVCPGGWVDIDAAADPDGSGPNGRTGSVDVAVVATGEVFREILSGEFEGPLAWDRLDAADTVLSALRGAADAPALAPVLAMLGWFEWARGRGSRAHARLTAARAAVPDYTLAILLSELVESGVLPRWARIRESAWTERSRKAA